MWDGEAVGRACCRIIDSQGMCKECFIRGHRLIQSSHDDLLVADTEALVKLSGISAVVAVIWCKDGYINAIMVLMVICVCPCG